MLDQASKLRAMVSHQEELAQKGIKIYSLLSPETISGGTNFALNLGVKLEEDGKKVLILDGSTGINRIDPNFNIENTLDKIDFDKEVFIKDLIFTGKGDLDFIPQGADLFFTNSLEDKEKLKLIESINDLLKYDIILIHNDPGISKESLTLAGLAHEIILTTSTEPETILDAYRILKVISNYDKKEKVKLVINEVQGVANGEEAYEKLFVTCSRFLSLRLEKLGFIFKDINIGKANIEGEPVAVRYPKTLASKNMEQISHMILEDRNYDKDISNLIEIKNKLNKLFG